MATSKLALLETRLAVLEAEVAQLKQNTTTAPNNGAASADWLDKIYGVFADDPIFDEVVELGRQYRESLRPKARRAKTKAK